MPADEWDIITALAKGKTAEWAQLICCSRIHTRKIEGGPAVGKPQVQFLLGYRNSNHSLKEKPVWNLTQSQICSFSSSKNSLFPGSRALPESKCLRTVKEAVSMPTFPPTHKTASTLRASGFTTSIYMLIREKLVPFQIRSHMIFPHSKQTTTKNQPTNKQNPHNLAKIFFYLNEGTNVFIAGSEVTGSKLVSISSTTLTTYFSYNEPSSIKLLRLFPRRFHCTDLKSENTTFWPDVRQKS